MTLKLNTKCINLAAYVVLRVPDLSVIYGLRPDTLDVEKSDLYAKNSTPEPWGRAYGALCWSLFKLQRCSWYRHHFDVLQEDVTFQRQNAVPTEGKPSPCLQFGTSAGWDSGMSEMCLYASHSWWSLVSTKSMAFYDFRGRLLLLGEMTSRYHEKLCEKSTVWFQKKSVVCTAWSTTTMPDQKC